MDWKVHKSQTVIDHHSYFVEECHYVHAKFVKDFPDKDSTWGYRFYNVFAATSPSPIWYNLYKDLLNFCTVDLSAFYFDIRKDCLYCDPKDSIKRQSTLL